MPVGRSGWPVLVPCRSCSQVVPGFFVVVIGQQVHLWVPVVTAIYFPVVVHHCCGSRRVDMAVQEMAEQGHVQVPVGVFRFSESSPSGD